MSYLLLFALFFVSGIASSYGNNEENEDFLEDILAQNLLKYGINSRQKRDEKPGLYFKSQTRQEANLPICQNMKGSIHKPCGQKLN